MAWVLVNDLTDSYIQSLIQRNGFQQVPPNDPDNGVVYCIIDLDGRNHNFFDMDSARSWLITQYVLQQNG